MRDVAGSGGRARPSLSRRALLAAVAGVVAAATLGSAPGAAAKAPPRFTGVHYPFASHVTPGTARHIRAAGARSVVINLYWPVIEAAPGTYDFASSDASIGDLAAKGIETTPVLYGTPRWALDEPLASDPNANHVPPTSSTNGPAGWAAFVQALVSRYGPTGSYWKGDFQAQHPGAKPLPIEVWQVWNEPNLAAYYWPAPRVKSYARLLKISHDAITAVDPSARIAIGGLVCQAQYTCQRYLRDLYRRPGVTADFDLVGLHPYGSSVPFVYNGVRRARHEMKRAHDGRTKIWVSEIGWGSAHRDHHLNKGRRGQAKLLTKAFRRLERNRRKLRIWRVDWFDWRDVGNSQTNCSWCPSAGLLDSHGHPKPAFKAFKRVS